MWKSASPTPPRVKAKSKNKDLCLHLPNADFGINGIQYPQTPAHLCVFAYSPLDTKLLTKEKTLSKKESL